MRPLVHLLNACITSILILVFGLPNKSTADESTGVPEFEQIESINLHTPNDWYLEIHRDGSGKFGYGALYTDCVRFPKGSFNPREVFLMLTPHLLKKDNTGKDLAVSVSLSTSKITGDKSSFVVRDQTIPARIFTAASQIAAKRATEDIANATKDPTKNVDSLKAHQERFQNLLRENPIAPASEK